MVALDKNADGITFSAPIDHVLGADMDRVTLSVGASFFGFVEGLVESFYNVRFDALLKALLENRSFGSASFEMVLKHVVEFIVATHESEGKGDEWTSQKKDELLHAFVKWVYAPGYPAVYLEPRNVDEDQNGQVWDINVQVNQQRFCIDGTEGEDTGNELECKDKSPEEIEFMEGVEVAPTKYNIRSVLMNVQYVYGDSTTMFELLRSRTVSHGSQGWVELRRPSDLLRIDQVPVDEAELAKNGYIFLERKASMAPLHLTLYPEAEYLNVADYFRSVLSGLDDVIQYEEFSAQDARDELFFENGADAPEGGVYVPPAYEPPYAEDTGSFGGGTESDEPERPPEEEAQEPAEGPGADFTLDKALGNKRGVAEVLLDVFYIGRDVLKAATSPLDYGQSPTCDDGSTENGDGC